MHTTSTPTPPPLQPGIVARLHPSAGFGYVRDQQGLHQYIFVFGSAIKHAQAALLAVGKPVKFRVSGHGRVEQLVLA